MTDFEVRQSDGFAPIALAFYPNTKQWIVHYLSVEDALKMAKLLEETATKCQ